MKTAASANESKPLDDGALLKDFDHFKNNVGALI